MNIDYVAFSGGKDSTALALLSPDAQPIFTDTGWEFQHVYEHIEKFEAVTGRRVIRVQRQHDGKPDTLPGYIKRYKFLPNHGARFCTREFKIAPFNQYLSSHLPASFGIGLRADEPPDLRVGNLSNVEGLTIKYPLRDAGIGLADVVRVCLDADLLPRAYPWSARGGCRGCFYKRKAEVQALHHLKPDVLDELQDLEEYVQDQRDGFFHMFPNAGMSIADMRRQPLLFDVNEVYAAAAETDDYGPSCGAFCNR